MDVLLFDMDGVLIRPLGYHYALKETVRLAGVSTGFGKVKLTDEQIAQFEALGISCEWHSSALCMAMMVLNNYRGITGEDINSQLRPLNLNELFEELAIQPISTPALKRGINAIEKISNEFGGLRDSPRRLVAESESIHHSPTMNWFQELILGSERFNKIYQKQSQLETESYLELYDRSLLSKEYARKLIHWATEEIHGAAIMTNRPSGNSIGYEGIPDAKLGAELVGLESLPLIGLGEISWLANQTGGDIGDLLKPSLTHSLFTILVASGWSLEKTIEKIIPGENVLRADELLHLKNSRITVFEDTPGGLVSVDSAAAWFNEFGLGIDIQKKGIAEDKLKSLALSENGAQIYSNVNQALSSLDDF
ncbi:MAG: hypothetical protein PVF83_13850 [Anaerolineales bacterium]|jgi:hypothetical protein